VQTNTSVDMTNDQTVLQAPVKLVTIRPPSSVSTPRHSRVDRAAAAAAEAEALQRADSALRATERSLSIARPGEVGAAVFLHRG
jgi:hypothetical protein